MIELQRIIPQIVIDFVETHPELGIDKEDQGSFIKYLLSECYAEEDLTCKICEGLAMPVRSDSSGRATPEHSLSGRCLQCQGSGKDAQGASACFVERAWTYSDVLRDFEFCHMVNDLICRDERVESVAKFCRVLNTFCVTGVTRGPRARQERWPDSGMTYRAGGMHMDYWEFFKPKVKYRAPRIVPTSFEYDEAFASRQCTAGSPLEPVKWTFHLPKSRRCAQANYITRRAGNLKEEHEFLFAAYSVFTVKSVHCSAKPYAIPHEIHVEVATDNRDELDILTSAPWC